jgi:nucleotide-binding universal stress UspA family protein
MAVCFGGIAMKTRKVLIPLDRSALSRQILPHVQRLLSPAEYELILLCVAEQPTSMVATPPRPISLSWAEPMYESMENVKLAQHPTYASQIVENIRAEIESELLDDMHHLREAGYTVSLAVRFGDPAREIVDFASHVDADLVAMATHGRTGLRRLLLGSVTVDVLQGLPMPMLLVRPFDSVAKESD